jgi:hypothetical protein
MIDSRKYSDSAFRSDGLADPRRGVFASPFHLSCYSERLPNRLCYGITVLVRIDDRHQNDFCSYRQSLMLIANERSGFAAPWFRRWPLDQWSAVLQIHRLTAEFYVLMEPRHQMQGLMPCSLGKRHACKLPQHGTCFCIREVPTKTRNCGEAAESTHPPIRLYYSARARALGSLAKNHSTCKWKPEQMLQNTAAVQWLIMSIRVASSHL